MEKKIEAFKNLLEIIETLMGPNGCPWDREQTLVSVRGSLLEEVYEVIDAIDNGDMAHLAEELGDLFFNVIFFCLLGEKEKKLTMEEVLTKIRLKLIERHPHVFGEVKMDNTEQVMEQWERIKHAKRESLMDGIPKALPSLARGYKIAGKMKRLQMLETGSEQRFHSQEELGEILWEIVVEAKGKGFNPEHALREELLRQERGVREHETKVGKK